MDQDRKSLLYSVMLLSALSFTVILLDWLFVSAIVDVATSDYLFILQNKILSTRLHDNLWMVKLTYILFLCLVCLLTSGSSKNDNRLAFVLSAVLLNGLFLFGYAFSFYNMYVYPIVFLSASIVTAQAIFKFKPSVSDEEFFKGVNKRKSDFMFWIGTTKFGKLYIPKPQQHIWIDGGPGSGKSQSLIKPMIKQAALRGDAGLIYDYEGDPTAENNPILTRVAYTAMLEAQEKRRRRIDKINRRNSRFRRIWKTLFPEPILTKFAFINFTDMSRTVRINIFSEKYFALNGETDVAIADLYFGNMAATLLKNLNTSFKEKQDFWYDTALIMTKAVFLRLHKDPEYQKKGFNTLPHAISVFLSDYNLVFRWLIEDRDVEMLASPIITPWKNQAMGQLSGTVSTLQSAFSKLLNPNIYWVMSKDDFNLDITGKNSPSLLCLGNAQSIKESVAPCLAMITGCVMKQMNQAGKEKSIFFVDELPTIIINALDEFIATVRKHFVAVLFGVQDYDQCARDYGEKSAAVLRSNCGNQFFGMTGNEQNARMVSEMFGEIRRKQTSITNDDSRSSHSTSESLQREKVVQTRDVTGQQVGEFMGKIANGNPVFFKCRFEEFIYDTKEIPNFSLPVETDDPQIAMKILKQRVYDNYEQIKEDVRIMLLPYQQTA